MKTFSIPVDKRSREAMTEYLETHSRYNTMNRWNNATSYSCNLKIHSLRLNNSVVNKLYELIQTDEFYDSLHELMYEFGAEHDFKWQAGFNGRSGGYLVLYESERKPSGYKSYCPKCGQKNFTSVTETGNICGVCRKPERRDFSQTHMNIHTFPGRGVDHCEDFGEWDIYSLRRRVELVQEFDALADAIVAEAVYMAENCAVEEETFYTPQTRKVMAYV